MVAGPGGGGFPWDVLGLAPTPDEKAIRTAYAALVRQYRPDSHPQEFSRIREAYELAMQWARRLQAQLEAEAVAEAAQQAPEAVEGETATEAATAAQDAAWPAPQAAEPPTPQTAGPAATAPDTLPAVAPPAEPSPPPVPVPWQEPPAAEPSAAEPEEDTAPGWQPHEAVQALSTVHNMQGEIAAAALLRQHLVQSAGATIDDRLDYEALLLRSLLVSEAPPLALVFEGNRSFGWSARLDDVAHAFGDQAARRLALLADTAERWLYASQYSPNGWDRHLFAPPGRRLPWFAAAGLVAAAHGTAAEWLQNCDRLELPALRGRLNPLALRRMQGPLVLAPDLGLALMALLLCLDLLGDLDLATGHTGAMAAAVAAAVAVPLLCCVGLRWCGRQRIARPAQLALAWLRKRPYLGLVGLGSVLVGGGLALGSPWPPVHVFGAAVLLLGVVGLLALLLWLVWFAGQGLETALLRLFLRPLAVVARHAFQAQRQQAAAPWQEPNLRERLRLLPAAWKEDRAQKQRDRQRRKALGGRRPVSSWWWLLPVLAALLNALSHLGK